MPINPTGLSQMHQRGVAFPELTQQVIQTPYDMTDFRKFLFYHKLTKSKSVIFPIHRGCSTARVDRIAEGTQITMNLAPIESIECVAYKIGRGFQITYEVQRWQQIPYIQEMIRNIKLELYNTVYGDIMTAIAAGVPAANVIAAGGNSLGRDMNVGNIAGTIGQFDILAGKRILEENYKGDSVVLLVNPRGHEQVSALFHYSDKDVYGAGAPHVTGLRGRIEGCDIYVSNLVPAGTAWLLAVDPQSWKEPSSYTPIGFFFDDGGIRALNRPTPHRDAFESYFVWIYGVCITRGHNIVEITFTGYS